MIFLKLKKDKVNLSIQNNTKSFSDEPAPPKKKIDLSKISVYKRISNNLGIPFQSSKSQIFLKESIEEGNSVAFFDLMDQFQTQSDPTFCGPTTLIVILNSLGLDPNKKWKGYFFLFILFFEINFIYSHRFK